MLTLKHAEVQNFLSFGNTIQTFDLASSGFHWIDGINLDDSDENGTRSVGSGKSSLTMIFEYALYGDTQKINKSIKRDKLINRNYQCDMLVALEFDTDKESYRIERYRKHSVHKDNLYLFVRSDNEWIPLSKDDKNSTQDLINEIILINQTTFRKSVLLTRDDRSQFLELTVTDRAKIFENIIQLNKLRPYFESVRKKRSALAKESESCDVNMRALKVETSKHKRHIEEQVKIKNSSIKRIEKEITALKKENAVLSKYDVTELKHAIKVWYDKQGEIDRLTAEIETIQKECSTKHNSIETYKAKLKALTKRISDLVKKEKNASPITCANCGAIQNEADFKKQLASILSDKKRYTKEQQEIEESIAVVQEEISNNKTIIKTLEKKLATVEKIVITFADDFELCQLVETKSYDEMIEFIDEFGSVLEIKEKELEKVKSQDISIFKKYIEKNVAEYQNIKKRKNEVDFDFGAYDFWYNVLDLKNENSIKQHLVSKLIPVFNQVLQANVDYVYQGKMHVSFDSMFNETIIYDGQPVDYIELSTGERLKLNMALNFSIFDLTRINLLGSSVVFLDEVFVNVDVATLKLFIDMIRDKYAKTSAVYFISHQAEIEEIVQPQTKMLVQKKNGDSSIAEMK